MVEARARRCLVIEDEALVAMMVADHLADLGYEVVGPASTLKQARELATSAEVDAALCDLSLHGQLTSEIGDILSDRNIPYALMTGYDSAPEGMFPGVEILRKPFLESELEQIVGALLATPTHKVSSS
jgi:CheY-like chemotaxis protein